jgi:hypothetical protein
VKLNKLLTEGFLKEQSDLNIDDSAGYAPEETTEEREKVQIDS